VNFLLIAILPFVFFRRDGKFTLMWCLTALPYVIALLFLVRTVFVEIDLITELGSRARHLMQAAGAVLSCASVGMILMTIGSHRVPLALWHQDKKDDEPAYIVTWGSYKYIRHPFYSAFVLAWIAGALVAPTGIMLGLAGYACALLVYTARKEERRLANEDGQLGQEYRLYMKRTGRFLPRVSSAI
jgi:protein-S-isoprenylcysteine O-methyltransferase Ste14